eukprot:4775357-Pleurochrysis_carterae.AAC.7
MQMLIVLCRRMQIHPCPCSKHSKVEGVVLCSAVRTCVRTCVPSSKRHTRAVLSRAPVTTCLPLGVTQTESTQLR